MNILQIHTRDTGGGGAKMVSDLNSALNEREHITSELLVGVKKSESANVTELPESLPEKAVTHGLEQILSLQGFGSLRSLTLRRHIREKDIDLVHLHNLHGKYINMFTIKLIPDDVPVVWTFHDKWPFTGGCTYSYGCTRFTDRCGSCPELDRYPKMRFDTTRLLLSVKRRLFNDDRYTVLTPSMWLKDQVERSHLDRLSPQCVPNAIRADFFKPHDSSTAKEAFGIDPTDTVILVVASNLDNPQKGMDLLFDALEQVDVKSDVTLLAIGETGSFTDNVADDFSIVTPGYIPESELPLAYSAGDLCVVPSRIESFGLVATEAMSCETPVVAFEVGGLAEQVTAETGWLVPPYETDRMARTIESALDDPATLSKYGSQGRQRVLDRYGFSNFVDEHVAIYRDEVEAAC